MKKPKVIHKTIVLNGTKVWLTVLSLLITYGGTSVWWAATTTNTLSSVKNTVIEMRTELRDKVPMELHNALQAAVDVKANAEMVAEIRDELKEHMRGK